MSSRALTQIYDEALRPTGLRVTQYSLLKAIAKLGPASFQTLAEALVLDPTTLPRSLRVLEKDGYIAIEPGADRRQRLAGLTARGRKILEECAPYWRQAQERVRAKFSGGRLDALLAELADMREAVAG